MSDLVKYRLLVLLSSLFLDFQGTRAQSTFDAIDTIRNRFERSITNLHQEKVFVHLDRTSYITGETIWFSAYCVDAASHTPVGLSRVLNVELLDVSGQAVKQIRIKLSEGLGNGQIFITPDIPTGHYIVRAYTSWMKNFRAEFVFKKHIKIVNPTSIRDTGVAGTNNQPAINFFPEGGQLVAGLKSKVAVKASDSLGNGLAVSGIIYDHQDNEVAEFTTSESGYTYFFLTPGNSKTYIARAELDSVIHKYQLPPVKERGLTLSVNPDEAGDLNILIEHSEGYQEKPYLVVHTRGIIVKLLQIDLKNTRDIHIEASELSAGISHITLLNSDFSPLCERLVFKYPDISNFIDLNIENQQYHKREKIDLALKRNEKFSKDDLAHLSVSVYHSSGSDHDIDDIISNLLLTSDLAGPVPQPWIFFDPENESRAEQLDLVMLTNGWRRFYWNEVKNDQHVRFKYPAEINAPILSGQVLKSEHQNLPKSVQINFLGKASVMNSVALNPDGLFNIEVPFRVNNENVLFFINDDTLRSDQVSIISPFDLEYSEARNFPRFSLSSRKYLETLNTNIQIAQVYRNTSYINGLQTEDELVNTPFYGVPDNLYLLDNYTRFETIEDLFIEYIRTAVIRDNRRTSGFQVIYDNGLLPGKALTLIDGVPILDFDYVINFDPLVIEKIGIVNEIYRMGGIEYSGIVDFTTYRGDFDGQELPNYIVEKVYHGLQQPRLFYAPDYSGNQDLLARIPDYRNTLYWNPHVKISGTESANLEFYTSDDAGIYQIEVNGITNNGQPVFLRSSFEVK